MGTNTRRHDLHPQQAKVISQLYERYIDPIYNGMGSRLWTTYISRNPYEGGRKPTGAQAMHTILRWFIRETEKDTLTNTEAASLFYTHMEGVVEYQQLIKYVWTEASPNH